MAIGKINESDIINMMIKTFGQPKERYLKIGDDVARMPVWAGELIIKMDMLVGKTDVPKGMRLWQISRKSVVACVSDFAAKGVKPKAVLLSLGLPSNLTLKDVHQLALGFRRTKKEFNVEIIGGDTNESDDLVIDCCMIGFSKKITERKGAKPGDRVIVTGPFGYPSMGLKILQEDLKTDREVRNRSVASVLLPTPKLKLGLEMNKRNLFSSSIDSSDGLAISLHQLSKASGVGFELNQLPVEDDLVKTVKSNDMSIQDIVLYGGEEYEIVATIPEEKMKSALRLVTALGFKLFDIGRVTNKPDSILFDDGSLTFKVEKKGWIHFS